MQRKKAVLCLLGTCGERWYENRGYKILQLKKKEQYKDNYRVYCLSSWPSGSL